MTTDQNQQTTRQNWPHAPAHWFIPNATYFVTSATFLKHRLFNTPEKLDFLQASFFEEANCFGWSLHAWAFMSNHYHVVMQAPKDAKSLKRMLQAVHSKTALWLNKLDVSPGRQVWYNYRDTCLTFRNSYFARLNYTNRNPERHKLVRFAEEYKWCSMAWFAEKTNGGFQKTVASFPIDRVNVWDDFD